ncbi:PQQ-binding-like beta-propeller repeat protein [Gimesia sp.]|uniref:outer membrane protein assembly factor BamB family protein n=1 Tax=Gimesia sp. TaxID=2024833 RepID=UPI003A8D2CE2
MQTPSPPLVSVPASSRDWPGWRGPVGNGVAAHSSLPLNWSTSEGIIWKTSVSGVGNGSPSIWGQQLFLVTADNEAETVSLACYDTNDGHREWSTQLVQGSFGRKHQKNTFASTTPACDGTHVYVTCVVDDTLWVTAVGMNGKIAWKTETGPFYANHGYSASPVVDKSLVFVSGEHKGYGTIGKLAHTSFLAALDTTTGKIVWRVRRSNGDSYNSPVIARVANRSQLLLAGPELIIAHDPETGKELWSCRWVAERPASTVIFDAEHVFAAASHPDSEILCIAADGQGDVTETHVRWSKKKGGTDVPSLLEVDGLIYSIHDQGVATCLDAKTGDVVWRTRLRGNFTASPVVADGRIYATNEDGTTYVFQAGREYSQVAMNQLAEPVLASPAISNDQIFIRTDQSLICIGASKHDVLAEGQKESSIR